MSSAIHKDEFPREKLINYGADKLSNYELLAIVLNTGTKKENVLELAKRILSKYDNQIKSLCCQSFSSLNRELGIGEAKACKILAISELSRRLNLPCGESPVIKSAKDLADILIPKISHLKAEHLIAVYLNSRKRVLRMNTLFIGSLDQSIICSREIFKVAIEENASAVILAHNHPSGDPTPSESDLSSTKEIQKAGEIMGIEVLDHIIIGDNRYWSLRESGFF
jgi:DNA repair protein RadC